MTRLARICVVTLSIVVFLYVSLGYVLGKTNDDKSYRSLSVYGEVLQHIQEDYVDQPNMALVTAGA
ncbi:MAG: S41 family peptidase, partial [Candidatus Acidiferrales bacterium]